MPIDDEASGLIMRLRFCSVLRYAFLDSEDVFKAFVDSGLELTFLNAITELRKKTAGKLTLPPLQPLPWL